MKNVHNLQLSIYYRYTILNTYRMAAVSRRRRLLTESNPRWSNQVDIKYQGLLL